MPRHHQKLSLSPIIARARAIHPVRELAVLQRHGQFSRVANDPGDAE